MPAVRTGSPIRVVTRGILPTDAATVIHQHLAPILGLSAVHSRVRLTRLSSPGLVRPILAQIDVQLAEHRVRGQVAAATMSEVPGMLAQRTIEQLQSFPGALPGCLQTRATTSLPPSPPELLSPRARCVARHRVCRLVALTTSDAVAELEAMDYRFHLFCEKYSRQDSIVIRVGPGSYRLVQPKPNPIGLDVTSPPLAVAPAPGLSLAEATAHLDLTGEPFEAFTDRTTGRACVLYARYDGHYGLMTPAPALSRSG